LVDVICDTSFLIHLSTNKIRNLSNLETEIGPINFVVPQIVIKELEHLLEDPDKKNITEKTLETIKNFNTNDIDGKTADLGILDFVKKHRGIVATMDQNLKKQIKESGGSVLSMHNDKIVLEN
jgi:hypothetical protein|tara:strand:+ start:135 stop:503 length:369 start_codon:yes stop_codon:yes gene_type:complete